MAQTAAPALHPTVAARAAARTPWIVGSWQDLLLFAGTPLLILPLYFLTREAWRSDLLPLTIVALGGVGHHLPGMMRAYGDRALFERYKLRFVVAPLFLILMCCGAGWLQLQSTQLIVLFWGLWHTLAQTYGFLRIYDAKVGSFAPWTSRLDRAMCIAWFGGAAFFSEPRMTGILTVYSQCGGPAVPPAAIGGLRAVWAAGTALVTLLFLANLARSWRAGRPQSPVKLFALATSIAFWWFCMTSFTNVIVGVALFELFHDTQYLAIVWLYNKSRAEKDPASGAFTRFLFRRSALLVALYVALVLAYGGGSRVVAGLEASRLRDVLLGLVLASTFLHYYYDGFIWRVRERSTRESLGVAKASAAEQQSAPPARRALPVWAGHALAWSLFVVPLVGFGSAQMLAARPAIEWRAEVAAALPRSAPAHHALGVEQAQQQDFRAAAESFRRSLAIDPDQAGVQANLGTALLRLKEPLEAARAFRAALALDPRLALAQRGLGDALLAAAEPAAAADAFRAALALDGGDLDATLGLGRAALESGQPDAAVEAARRALALDPAQALAHLLAGDAERLSSRWEECIPHYRRALERDDRLAGAAAGLAIALHQLGREDEALAAYRRALELDPELDSLHYNLALLLQGRGQHEQAARHYELALQHRPDFAEAHANLGVLLQQRGELERALAHYRRSLELRPEHARTRLNLGLALRELGREADAAPELERALRLDPSLSASTRNP